MEKKGLVTIQEVGYIREIKKNIARVTGLQRCMNGQLVDITSNTNGIIMGFTEEEILILLIGNLDEVKVGDKVYNRMEPFVIPVGEVFLGRVVNALAEPVDGKGGITPSAYYPIFRDAPAVLERVPISEVLETGILIIDATIPIGKGQRELIVGDRITGKTTVCVDTILNQKGKGVVCIYCCIGKTHSSLQRVMEIFNEKGALEYTIVVSATASTSVGDQYLAPYTACTLGEYFMDKGKDVFVVFDDLTKHAWAYRQLSLLLERFPGRDAYPGDIFYIHSQLMERAGNLAPERGGGSMTFFPIVDTLEGDVTGYVPSNLISMTDGQIYLNAGLFSSGFRPAIDLGLSVSRIGNRVQSPAMRELSGMLRLEYLQYRELVKVTRFKTSISESVAKKIRRGEVISKIFVQLKNEPRSHTGQILLLYTVKKGILERLPTNLVEYFKAHIFGYAKEHFPQLVEILEKGKELSPTVIKLLDRCVESFLEKFAYQNSHEILTEDSNNKD